MNIMKRSSHAVRSLMFHVFMFHTAGILTNPQFLRDFPNDPLAISVHTGKLLWIAKPGNFCALLF
jgi:hypothetical protein